VPVSRRKWEFELRRAGCEIRRTKKAHYAIYRGNEFIDGYAVKHPGDYVLDVYVRRIRKKLG